MGCCDAKDTMQQVSLTVMALCISSVASALPSACMATVVRNCISGSCTSFLMTATSSWAMSSQGSCAKRALQAVNPPGARASGLVSETAVSPACTRNERCGCIQKPVYIETCLSVYPRASSCDSRSAWPCMSSCDNTYKDAKLLLVSPFM